MKAQALQERIEAAQRIAMHEFSRSELLIKALTHSSYANEAPSSEIRHNDRLEFLGDAVIDMLVAEMLFLRYPDLSSGEMTKLRASVVNESSLAGLSRIHRLGSLLLLGIGEERTGGATKNSVLADAYESLLGAVFLDGGLDAARAMVHRDMENLIEEQRQAIGRQDYKSKLQEICAKQHRGLPKYIISGRSGPDHATCFTIECHIGEKIYGSGEGRSIKCAEQNAARNTLDEFEKLDKES